MSDKRDGGHALPFGDMAGISLRDYIATHVLPFCLKEFGGNPSDLPQPADAAYQIADAMIVVRRRPPEDTA